MKKENGKWFDKNKESTWFWFVRTTLTNVFRIQIWLSVYSKHFSFSLKILERKSSGFCFSIYLFERFVLEDLLKKWKKELFHFSEVLSMSSSSFTRIELIFFSNQNLYLIAKKIIYFVNFKCHIGRTLEKHFWARTSGWTRWIFSIFASFFRLSGEFHQLS